MPDLGDYQQRRLDRYGEELARGLHDDDCEARERSSLCHCSKRRREREGKTELPELWFYAPVCGGCDQEVEFDGDGFDCPRCHVSWGRDANDGDKADEWTDDYGSDIGGEQWGERLLVLALRPAGKAPDA